MLLDFLFFILFQLTIFNGTYFKYISGLKKDLTWKSNRFHKSWKFGKFVRTNNGEDEKKKEASSTTEGGHTMSNEKVKGIAFPIIGARLIINILIGMGYTDLHCTIQERKGKPGQPIARLTPLGSTCIGHINGLLQRSVQTNLIRTYNTKETELQEINSTLAKFWEIESVAGNVRRVMNEDDKDTLDLVSKSLRYENGKYLVQILWKKERNLTNSYQMALNQLDNTERRLIKQPELGEKYCEIIEQYIKKGYLEYDGKSLNDVIQPGPKLQQDLVDVLLRFRRYPVALGCGIAEMY